MFCAIPYWYLLRKHVSLLVFFFFFIFFSIFHRCVLFVFFFFSSRRRHTRWNCDWSSDVCSSDLGPLLEAGHVAGVDADLEDVVEQGRRLVVGEAQLLGPDLQQLAASPAARDRQRSEERRVGKEWRGGRARDHVEEITARGKSERA